MMMLIEIIMIIIIIIIIMIRTTTTTMTDNNMIYTFIYFSTHSTVKESSWLLSILTLTRFVLIL